MESVRNAALASLRIAGDSARLASQGASQAYSIAADKANKTKLDLQELYLQRQTKLGVDFVPAELASLLSQYKATCEVVREMAEDLKRRSDSEMRAGANFARTTKTFTSVAYAAQQQGAEPMAAHDAVVSLSECYDKLREVCVLYGRHLLSIEQRLRVFVEDECVEVEEVRHEFADHVQQMHIARMQSQAARAASPPDPKVVADAEQHEATTRAAFDSVCHKLTAAITQFLHRHNALLAETMNSTFNAERSYAAARVAAIQAPGQALHHVHAASHGAMGGGGGGGEEGAFTNSPGFGPMAVGGLDEQMLRLGGDVLVLPMSRARGLDNGGSL